MFAFVRLEANNYFKPKIQMANIAKIYQDGTYANKNPKFGDDSANHKITNAIKACREFALPHRTIAEIGCGGGAIILGVANELKAESSVGYEPMPEAYAIAKSRETQKVLFTNETINSESAGNFDLVLCFDVFEHIEDYYTFLRDLRRMGENYLFHIPLDMNAQMVARGLPLRRVREEVGHLHYFYKDSALAALSECGYEISGSFYTFGAEGSYKGGLLYKLMKYPRKILFTFCPDFAVRLLGGYSLMVWAKAGANKARACGA
ncbi:MAG: methylase [Verrucomicrobiales bacterium VVV1]|nr:MAG: methylase [Verrucomicrobiales bacterium VVV1]